MAAVAAVVTVVPTVLFVVLVVIVIVVVMPSLFATQWRQHNLTLLQSAVICDRECRSSITNATLPSRSACFTIPSALINRFSAKHCSARVNVREATWARKVLRPQVPWRLPALWVVTCTGFARSAIALFFQIHTGVAGDRFLCKTIDIRKVYKNLPIESSLDDAYICVYSPQDGEPRVFQTWVLPFGARAAVVGFCCAFYAIWRIGVVVFNSRWTVYLDDFFLVAEVHESGHVDMAQTLLFLLMGWQTSCEKEGGFGSTGEAFARAPVFASDFGPRFGVHARKHFLNHACVQFDQDCGRCLC
eukprot:s4720_g1.t1